MKCVHVWLLHGLGAALAAREDLPSMEKSSIPLQELLNQDAPIAEDTMRLLEERLAENWDQKDYIPGILGAHRIEYRCAPAIAIAFKSTRNGRAWQDVFDVVYPDSKGPRILEFPRTGICLLSPDLISGVHLDQALKNRVVGASKLALLANENVHAAVAGKQDIRDNISKLTLDYSDVESARWLLKHGFFDILNDCIATDVNHAWKIIGILAYPEDIVHSGDPRNALNVYRNLDVACTNIFDFNKSLFQAALKLDDLSTIKFVAQECMPWLDQESIFAFGSLPAIKHLKELNIFDAFGEYSACNAAVDFDRIDVLKHALELDPRLQCTNKHLHSAFQKGNRLFVKFFNDHFMDRNGDSTVIVPTMADYEQALFSGSIEGVKLILELRPDYYAADDDSVYQKIYELIYWNFC